MTDTPRTLAALQALFADNASGDISPQDLRDFLVSVMGVGGSTYPRPLINAVKEATMLPVSSSLELCNFTGAGTVNSIWLAICTIVILDSTIFDGYLDFYFNGEGTASIQVKLRDVFFCRSVTPNYWHPYFGRTVLYYTPSEVYQESGYLKLPMPYQNGCRIVIRNTSETSPYFVFSMIDASVGVDLSSDRRGKMCVSYLDQVTVAAPVVGTANAAVSTTTGPPGTLTDTRAPFVAHAHIGDEVYCNGKTMIVADNTTTVLTGTTGWSGGENPGNGRAYNVFDARDLLNVSGRGELAGVLLYLDMTTFVSMEGNIKFYRDGELTPSFYSSGTEDFFGGGFYFLTADAAHVALGREWGLLVKNETNKIISAYRWFLNQPCPFDTGLRITYQNGEKTFTTPGAVTLSAVVWYYLDDGATP